MVSRSGDDEMSCGGRSGVGDNGCAGVSGVGYATKAIEKVKQEFKLTISRAELRRLRNPNWQLTRT
jgi:hypothetical protein